MSYSVALESRARREILDLPRNTQRRIADILDDLSNNPRPPGAKKLVGQDGYRVRTGDYRVLYTIDDRKHLVRIYRIGHRREVYR
jgi:mRNA interferase RelE/StbE